jgi:hypothetical protein
MGAPERWVDGEAAQMASGGGVQRRQSCSSGHRRAWKGPAAREGQGVRKLQEIVRIGGSGRSSPGNGGRWLRSARIRAREGLPVDGGGGSGMGSGGEKCGAREGYRREVGDGVADGVSGTF